jgi:hypothetical protein
MTDHQPTDDDIDSPAAFEAALTELVAAAHEAGVDVEGAWECRPTDGTRNWEANVVELAADDD